VQQIAVIRLHSSLLYLAANEHRHQRRMICTWLHAKAIYTEGRFKQDKQTLQQLQQQLGFKGTHIKTINKWIHEWIKHKLATVKDNCIYLADWKEFNKLYQLDGRKKVYEFTLSHTQTVEIVLDEFFWQTEKQFFEQSQRANVANDALLRDHLTSVSDRIDHEALHRYQRDMFCSLPPGTFDYDHEWFMLYAKKKERKYYYKADTHLSVEHMSNRLGYARKNGFCYRKKRLIKANLIVVNVREYEVKKSYRTTTVKRDTGIGTFFYDRSTGTQKLRIVDEVLFLSPGLAAPCSVPEQGAQAAKKAA